MIVVGLLVGFNFTSSPLEVVAGIVLLLLFGYAFSWIFAYIALISSSAEGAQALGFMLIFPLTFASSAFVPPESMPSAARGVRRGEPVQHDRRRHARAVRGRSGGQRRVGGVRLVHRPDRRLRDAFRLPLQARGQHLSRSCR